MECFFTSVKSFSREILLILAYPHILFTNFCRFILILHQITLIFQRVPIHSFHDILIGPYTRPTHGCHFEWPWVTLNDLLKYSMTRSVIRSCMFLMSLRCEINFSQLLMFLRQTQKSQTTFIRHSLQTDKIALTYK